MKRILICVCICPLVLFYASALYAQAGDDTDVLIKRGFSQIHNRDLHESAMKDFERVIMLAPQYVDAYIGKAMILKKQGKWRDARDALLEGSRAIEGDPKAGRYLTETAWREGFYDLARQLNRLYPVGPLGKLLDYQHEAVLNYGYDWVRDRDDWWEMNFTYQHAFRPDQSILLYYSDFRRDADNDFLAGFGYVYKWNYMATLALDATFSDKSGFTAEQKYRPRLYLRLPLGMALGTGGNFDKFSDGWSKVSYTEVTKYFNGFNVKYTVLAGEDNLNQTVVTHIGEVGYEKEGRYHIRTGYATGNESIERGDRVIDSSVVIDTYFISGKYFFSPDWGLNLAATREYREEDLFRTSGSISMFYKF